MDLKNKVVLITGSSSGIGRATALAFAKEGSNLIINYNVNKEGGESVLKEVEDLGVNGILIQADVSNPDDVKDMFDKVLGKFGTIDILINNAAIPNDQVPYFEASFEDITKLINTDLVAPMICTQHALKIMQKNKSGKIINTSSIRGWEHGGRSVVYAASKAGLNSFTRTLAKHVAPDIQVNAIAPGFVKTRNYDNFSDDQVKVFMEQTLLKRFVTEEEIAEAFIFLAKNDAMTGQVIYVDAGFTLK